MVDLAKAEYKCVYVLYLAGYNTSAIRKGMRTLQDTHSGKEVPSCMTAIPERIQPRSDPDKAGKNHTPITQEFVPSINWSDLSQLDHFVQFYETDDFLLDSISDFIGAGLGSGAAC